MSPLSQQWQEARPSSPAPKQGLEQSPSVPDSPAAWARPEQPLSWHRPERLWPQGWAFREDQGLIDDGHPLIRPPDLRPDLIGEMATSGERGRGQSPSLKGLKEATGHGWGRGSGLFCEGAGTQRETRHLPSLPTCQAECQPWHIEKDRHRTCPHRTYSPTQDSEIKKTDDA